MLADLYLIACVVIFNIESPEFCGNQDRIQGNRSEITKKGHILLFLTVAVDLALSLMALCPLGYYWD